MRQEKAQRVGYLAKRMLDGARALYEFFEELRSNREVSPEDLAARLRGKYELTSAQRAYLEDIAIRASRAQGIIRYLEDRFRVDDLREFRDPKGLYGCLYRTKRLPKNISAHSYNIAVGFTKYRWLHKNIGFVNGSSPVLFDQLGVPLESTISRLEEGKTTACADLSFSMPNLDHLMKIARERIEKETESERIIRSIYGPNEKDLAEGMRKEIEGHELRHIFDEILGNPGCPFKEFVADLYAVDYSTKGVAKDALNGLGRDFKGFRGSSRIKYWEDKLARFRELNIPVIILKHTEESLERSKREAQVFKEEVRSLINLIRRVPKKECPIISYVISTTGDYRAIGKFAHRLGLLEQVNP